MANSQQDAVLKWLRMHNTITSQIAFREYGVTRLASVIQRLRKRGYTIKTNMEYDKTRYGTVSGYARYTLIAEPIRQAEAEG